MPITKNIFIYFTIFYNDTRNYNNYFRNNYLYNRFVISFIAFAIEVAILRFYIRFAISSSAPKVA